MMGVVEERVEVHTPPIMIGLGAIRGSSEMVARLFGLLFRLLLFDFALLPTLVD